jgi:hypothetical protein
MSIDNIISIIVGLVVTGACGYATSLINKIHARNTHIGNAIMSLLRVEILDKYRHCTAQSKITLSEYETVEGLYKTYLALGGNGFIEGLILEIRQLPRGGKVHEIEELK